jgi:hypothetical protein
MMHGMTYWQRLTEGDVRGVVMPHDDEIAKLRRTGLSLVAIGERIGKRKSYVQQRLLRIAAREEDFD